MNYKLNIKYLLLLAIFIQTLTSCEDVVDIKTEELTPQLVIDAWVDNRSQAQTITLSRTIPYFDNNLPEGVSGASVFVIRPDTSLVPFLEMEDGKYVWTPEPNETLGEIGDEFGLLVQLDGKTYGSRTFLNRVPPVDSLTQTFEEESLGVPEGIYTEFFARDPIGEGDTYWIKTYKNGEFLNKPLEINIAYDAGFSPGAPVDGLIFIPPIRESTNRTGDSDGDDGFDVAPWAVGDSIKVEIHSISNEAFFFIATAQRQMINGFNGIFAEPVINTIGNIIDIDGEEEVLGVFNVAAISELSRKIE